MFTGLVEEIGSISEIEKREDSLRLKIKCQKVLEKAKIGDSICTNGVCLTAILINNGYFIADIMNESVKRTNLKYLKNDSKVNLEKSLCLDTPLGGHLVTGDVDCCGEIISIKRVGIAKIFKITFDKNYGKYIVEKGRISLDGASLTICDFGRDWIEVSLIPHSQKKVILGEKQVGYKVNIEFDLIGKYIERIINFDKQIEDGLTMEKLGKYGFL